MIINNILENIGNTPHVKINNLYDSNSDIWMKLERSNPGGSIKDRIAFSMVEAAEKKGILKTTVNKELIPLQVKKFVSCNHFINFVIIKTMWQTGF